MTRSSALPVLSLALLLGGCESILGSRSGPEGPLTSLPRQLSAAEEQVVQASNHFAFGLLREASARDTSSNVFLSPLSATMALGMAMNGARGGTFDEMRATLGFEGLSQDEINASYRDLTELILGLDDRVDMRIANALWARQEFPLHPGFVATTRDFFGAEARELDFAAPASLGIVNDWVSRSTNGRIPTILDRLDQDVVLYLMNAIYFKGTWTHPFDRRRTRATPFYRADGTQQSVQMMSLPEAKVLHFRDSGVQVVDLPYSREAFSMTLVLPGHDRSLDDVLATLDDATWRDWMGRLQETTLMVQLPRFRLEYEQILNETLRGLGMVTPLDPQAADFSGMSPVHLYIHDVRQKTFLEVNEEGTEAAAATSVGVAPTSAPPSFRADRPFLAVIRERLSGTILFIGIIGAPPAG